MKKPLVSITIVNWNGGEVFADCLKSLTKLTYPNWELIVVDNGSTDGSEKLPSNYKLQITNYKLIRNRVNLGFAPANNQGVKCAKGKYILLLNNDTKVTPDFLTKMVRRMEEYLSIGVMQPKMYMMDPPLPKASEGHSKIRYLDNAGSFVTRIGFLEHWGFGKKDGKEFSKEREVFSSKGACMLIRKEVIEKTGLFDDDFVSYFEESDFCWRVWLVGWRVVFFPDAHIKHKVGFTIQRLDVTKINYDYYKNRIMSLIKNLEFRNLVYILPVHLFISLGIALAFVVRGQTGSAGMILKAIAYNMRNLSKTLKKRSEVQNMRTISDSYIFDNLSKPVDFVKFFGDFKRVEKDLS